MGGRKGEGRRLGNDPSLPPTGAALVVRFSLVYRNGAFFFEKQLVPSCPFSEKRFLASFDNDIGQLW